MSKMPEEMEQRDVKKDHYFYQDDGGFQASHEDDRPGDVVYYLGIIDCLTHVSVPLPQSLFSRVIANQAQYGFVKHLEHFWKSLSNDEKQISPIPPERYGDRFVRFISGITKSPELAAEDAKEKDSHAADPNTHEGETSGATTAHGLADIGSVYQRRRGSSTSGFTKSAPGIGSENDVIDRAESSRERASRELEREDARPPEKKLTTARSPSAERGEPGGFTLPVVEEGTSGDEREGSPGGRRKEQ